MVDIKFKDIRVRSCDDLATEQVAYAIAEVFTESWLEGSSESDTLTVALNDVEYVVRQEALQ